MLTAENVRLKITRLFQRTIEINRFCCHTTSLCKFLPLLLQNYNTFSQKVDCTQYKHCPSHDLKIALYKNKKEKGVLRKLLKLRLQSCPPASPVSRQCCITRCTLLCACSALQHRAPCSDCTVQGIGNSFSPENWLVPCGLNSFPLSDSS